MIVVHDVGICCSSRGPGIVSHCITIIGFHFSHRVFIFPMTELSVCCHQSFVGRIDHSFDARHRFVSFCQWLAQNTAFFISKYARHKHNTISYFRKPWFSLWVKLEFDFLLYQLSELIPPVFFLVSSCKLNRLSKKQANFGHYLINFDKHQQK